MKYQHLLIASKERKQICNGEQKLLEKLVANWDSLSLSDELLII